MRLYMKAGGIDGMSLSLAIYRIVLFFVVYLAVYTLVNRILSCIESCMAAWAVRKYLDYKHEQEDGDDVE